MAAGPNCTAAACIIGDEILSGKTQDTNSHFLAKSLFELGIQLNRIEVIPDDTDTIKEAVARMSKSFDLVFTSGGIGPTHDDITYEAIAAAFGDRLELHKPTLQKMAEISPHMAIRSPCVNNAPPPPNSITLGSEHITVTPARLRMATLPSTSRVVFTPGLWVPLCIIENVYILPGIPKLFQAMLTNYLPQLAEKYKSRGLAPFLRRTITTMLPEGDIADALTQIQAEISSTGIKIGSYPIFGQPGKHRVCVTVVGKDPDAVNRTAAQVAQAIQGSLEPAGLL